MRAWTASGLDLEDDYLLRHVIWQELTSLELPSLLKRASPKTFSLRRLTVVLKHSKQVVDVAVICYKI